MSKPQLLIIDDDALTLRALERSFRSDFLVHTSPDAETVLVMLEGNPRPVYDVVLCDLHLRGMSGRDLYDHLRRSGSDLVSRFVVLTGFPPAESDPFAAALGPRYLTKPCAVLGLRAVLLSVALRRLTAA